MCSLLLDFSQLVNLLLVHVGRREGEERGESFLLHIYYAHLASVGFEHSICHMSLLTSFIHRESWSYVNDSNDFINKTKNLKDIPRDTLLVTADVVGLYPSIFHEAGLRAMNEALDKRENRNKSINDLIRMTDFWKKIAVNLIRLKRQYLAQLLAPNLYLHTPVFYGWC